MKFHEFLKFTPLEFTRLLEIKGDKETQTWRRDMERMRLQTWTLMRVHMSEKDQKKYPSTKSIMPFEWDHIEPVVVSPQPTEDEYKLMDNISAGGKR